MPLAFESQSHGTIAFGFFNIESDMLLLDHYFLFASDFCGFVAEVAGMEEAACEREWEVYLISDRESIGDLMGAIHGVRFTGFIGDTYRRFPFPEDPSAFKQKTEGFKNREHFESMIRRYAVETRIPFAVDGGGEVIHIGEYRFGRPTFQELIRYVWRGGYPRWQDGIRPPYVQEMRQKIEGSRSPLFEGQVFDES
jgi:hypothetical protein